MKALLKMMALTGLAVAVGMVGLGGLAHAAPLVLLEDNFDGETLG